MKMLFGMVTTAYFLHQFKWGVNKMKGTITYKNHEKNLKACPFCGGWSDFGIGESGSHCVVCNNCFACSEHFETEQKAQEAWNKRMVDE